MTLFDQHLEFVKTLNSWQDLGVIIHVFSEDGDGFELTNECIEAAIRTCESVWSRFLPDSVTSDRPSVPKFHDAV